MYKKLVLALFLSVGLSLSVAQADVVTYTLDPAHTQVKFSWNHFGFSTPGATFKTLEGQVKADETKPENASVNVVIQVDSIDTGVPLLNEHLLTQPDNYFKVKEHPQITFNSKSVKNISKEAKTFDLVGTLTINGVSKDVVLATKVNQIGEHPMWENAKAIGLDATTTIKRSDFGIDLYVPAVSDELEVTITVEAIEAETFKKVMAEQVAG